MAKEDLGLVEELQFLRQIAKRTEQERAALSELPSPAERLEAVGRLAMGVVHDMNNVLGVIMGLASLVAEELLRCTDAEREGQEAERRALQHSAREGVEEILEASRRGRDLTQRLLNIARAGDALAAPEDLGTDPLT